MNGLINKGVSSALARVFPRRAAILKIAEEKALGTRLQLPAHVPSRMEDVEMYSDHLLFNKRQMGPIGQYTK